jgi:uncharacterized protein (DUF1810 family)
VAATWRITHPATTDDVHAGVGTLRVLIMSDPFSLRRFIDAQDAGGIYDTALAELRAGRKVSHWMWFVFPQIAGLGRSSMARMYAISSLAEARAYLYDPILGLRLLDATQAVTDLSGLTAEEIFGSVDAMKFRSSMTLFARAVPDVPHFQQALDRYFKGIPDEETDRRLPSERDERHFGYIRTALDRYERDELDLRGLVADVDAAVSALLQDSEDAWFEKLRTAWSGLEIVYAVLVSEDRLALDDENRADIAESIAEIRALLAARAPA